MRHPTIHGITTSNTIRRIRKNIYRHKNDKNGDICEDKNCISPECIKSGIIWGFSSRKDNSRIQGFSNYKTRQRDSKDIKEENNYENEIFYNEENDDYSNEVFSSPFEDEIPEEINLYNDKEEINLCNNDDYPEEDEFKHYRIQLDDEYEKLISEWIIINKDQLNL